jgi:hypothetical protein
MPRSSRSKENPELLLPDPLPDPESEPSFAIALIIPVVSISAGDGRHRLAADLLVLGDAHVADIAGELLERRRLPSSR